MSAIPSPPPSDSGGPEAPVNQEYVAQKRDARRFLRRIPLILSVGYLLAHTYRATTEYTENQVLAAYAEQDSVEVQRARLAHAIETQQTQMPLDIGQLGVTAGMDADGISVTTSRFEGPELTIEGLDFAGHQVDLEHDPGVLDYSVTSLRFDPDHPQLGIPDLQVWVSPVRLYQPEQGRLSALLEQIQGLLPGEAKDQPRPYRIYYKQVRQADGSFRRVAMQLWLTEFQVTVAAHADEAPGKKWRKRLRESQHVSQKIDSAQVALGLEIQGLTQQGAACQAMVQQLQAELTLQQANLVGYREALAETSEKLHRLEKRFLFGKPAKQKRLQQERVGFQHFADSMVAIVEELRDSLFQQQQQMTWIKASYRQKRQDSLRLAGGTFPAYWYQAEQAQANEAAMVPVSALKSEADNQLYQDLELWMRIQPNAAPWYIKQGPHEELRPRMAVGAVYCTEIRHDVEEVVGFDMNAALSSNAVEGIAIGMYDRIHQPGTYQKAVLPASTLAQKAAFSQPDAQGSPIWDEAIYMKLYLKDLGTHKNSWTHGLFGRRREPKDYEDQYTFTFLMPLLVRGTWDVMPPEELIPDWQPPEARVNRGVHVRDFFPSWGIKIGWLGKIGSFIFSIAGLLCVIHMFFPGLLNVVLVAGRELIEGVKQGISWLGQRKGE